MKHIVGKTIAPDEDTIENEIENYSYLRLQKIDDETREASVSYYY